MSEDEKYQVFLACKTIFTGPNAVPRKPKKTKKQITHHQAELNKSIPNFNTEKIASIAQGLLQRGVFQSDLKAKAEFPSLSVPFPVKKTQQDVPKAEEVRTTTNILEEVSSAFEKELAEKAPIPPAPRPAETGTGAPIKAEAEAPAPEVNGDTNTNTAPIERTTKQRCPIPSLYHSYFPYSAQHCILTSTQQVLEECCFEFMKKWLPSEIEAHDEWDCAAAVELTKWMEILTKKEPPPQLPDEALQRRGPELSALLPTISQIRHTAVHRIPTTARGIGSMVHEAMRLAEILQDPLRMSQLEDLHGDIQNKIQTMELSKNALEDSLVRELEAIRLQREELDRKEEQMRVSTIKSDRDNKALTGVLVKQSVERIFSATRVLDDSSGFETADDGTEDE